MSGRESNRRTADSSAEAKTLEGVLAQCGKSEDFHRYYPLEPDKTIRVSCFRSRVDMNKINRDLLPYLQAYVRSAKEVGSEPDFDSLRSELPIDQVEISGDIEELERKLIFGYAMLQLNNVPDRFMLVNVMTVPLGHRQNNDTENEFSVVGPKVGFVENLDVNLFLMRQQITVPDLIFEELMIGYMSNRRVVVGYIEGVTNPKLIETVKQRLNDIDFDVIYDNSQLDQIISDNSNTPFPLFLSTERVDRAIYAVTTGQVIIFTNGSPYVTSGPSTILDFFISPEDYYLPWLLGTFFRLIRIVSVFFSIFATPFYVAVLTFHFEVIPEAILGPLIESRVNVPFPPVLEVIFLEMTIELLREAGARLPTKIGQTLGIVGGIVIGQAAVQAALTSNILLIIVALSALASFTTPIFKMANTIRFLRYPFIIFAALWGGLGIVAGCFLLLGHLLRLKSLGTPYMLPLYPLRKGNFNDGFIRASYQYTTKRAKFLKPLSITRYRPSPDKEDLNDDDI